MTEIEESRLYRKCLGALVGGVIGDALGAPTESCNSFDEIEKQFKNEIGIGIQIMSPDGKEFAPNKIKLKDVVKHFS